MAIRSSAFIATRAVCVGKGLALERYGYTANAVDILYWQDEEKKKLRV